MRIKFVEGDEEDMSRAISLQELSTQLVDAFMESEGEHKAVVFADRSNDLAPFWGVEYDKNRKCIIIRVGYPDYDIDNNAMKQQIAEANAK